jgi:UDP-glucose:(heptosyl)LPS alpha-1,3-glucosyltransferase
MKIALLRQRLTGSGGAETTLEHLVRGLNAAGHEVAVYASDPEPSARRLLPPGAGYVRVPVWGGKTLRALTYAAKARRLLNAAPDRLVFSLERTPGAQVYRAGDGCHREWLARRAPLSSLPARWGQQLNLFHRVMLTLERRLFSDPHLKRVIANSTQVRDEIIQHYGLEPQMIPVIYNGLDRSRFQPLATGARAALQARLGLPAAAKIILFVGSGFKRKGLAYLIAAFSSLKDKDRVLWVVGKGKTRSHQRLAQRLGVADRVRFWGPQANAAIFYQAAAALALPTIYDPCSNVVLEALGCGTPTITTMGNGAREFITGGVNGAVLARPDDLPGLTAALEEYLDRGRDPAVRRAAAAAVADLSWDATTAQTLAVLAEAAE